MILSFINIRKVPREMLKTSGFALGFQHLSRDLANVNELEIMFDPYIQSLIHYSINKSRIICCTDPLHTVSVLVLIVCLFVNVVVVVVVLFCFVFFVLFIFSFFLFRLACFISLFFNIPSMGSQITIWL